MINVLLIKQNFIYVCIPSQAAKIDCLWLKSSFVYLIINFTGKTYDTATKLELELYHILIHHPHTLHIFIANFSFLKQHVFGLMLLMKQPNFSVVLQHQRETLSLKGKFYHRYDNQSQMALLILKVIGLAYERRRNRIQDCLIK